VEGWLRASSDGATMQGMADDPPRTWRDVASAQAGLITREQARTLGVQRWSATHRIESERWQELSPTVLATTTGELSAEQRQWLGVLNAGPGAILGGLTAAEGAGLRNWSRDEITVLVPYANDLPAPLHGIDYQRSRRDLSSFVRRGADIPYCRIEPAVLMFAARDRSERTAQGVLAAVVQQQLTTPGSLTEWLDRLRPLRRAALFRRVLLEIGGGAQSLAELDVTRMCRSHRLAKPARQVKRHDADGRLRFTDCEWRLADGRTLVLEVDGAFHMEVESWEDDLARQRALAASDRIIVRCTSRELRDEPERVVRDLVNLGVPRAA
jgi:very-short-patch-repair endonuclease